MLSTLVDAFAARLAPLFGQSGLFTSGHGLLPRQHEPMEIAIALLLGGLGGFIAGLLAGRMAKFFAFIAGHNLPTTKWAIYGAIIGAIIAGILETFGD
jgi:hypothetical protein